MAFGILKKVIQITLWFIFVVCIWLLCAWGFPYFKKSSKIIKTQKPVTIYVKTNGVHTDIVLPRKGPFYRWDEFIDASLFMQPDSAYQFIAVGWGDKGFYLDTPTWDDLKASTAFRAAFGLGSTAMHVTYYQKMKPGPSVKEIHISEAGYQKLVSYIRQSFKTEQNRILLIAHPAYGEHDHYFEAKGTYSLFKTCNVWTGNALKEAGVRLGIWTPLAFGIMDHL